MWFAYFHFWATDVFSMDLDRDCKSSLLVNQKSVVEREAEWSESSTIKEEGFGWRLTVISCNWLWLRVTAQEDINKSNQSNQTPVIISPAAINSWQYFSISRLGESLERHHNQLRRTSFRGLGIALINISMPYSLMYFRYRNGTKNFIRKP
jgi:hypothetical protein